MSTREPSDAAADAEAIAGLSVPLPRRSGDPRAESTHIQASRPPVWSIDSAADASLSTPLPSKCDRHGRPDGICCKDLKDDDERQLIDPDIIRDVYVALVYIPFGWRCFADLVSVSVSSLPLTLTPRLTSDWKFLSIACHAALLDFRMDLRSPLP